jgi:hypothetical protein
MLYLYNRMVVYSYYSSPIQTIAFKSGTGPYGEGKLLTRKRVLGSSMSPP